MKKRLVMLWVVAALSAVMLTGCGEGNRNSDETVTEETKEPSGMVHIDSADDVTAFFDEVYGGVAEDLLPYEVTTTELSLDDEDLISYHTGLAEVSGIDGIYLSESMMSSTAYSAVYIRTKDDADAEEIRQQLMDSINPSKWICVTAEKQIAATFGKDIFFVMGSAETADAVFERAKEAAESRNMVVSDTIEKTNPI